MKVEEIAVTIYPLISTREEIDLSYLFGSSVKVPGALSDIDIAVLLNRKQSYRYKYELNHELCVALKRADVDLVILNKAPISLKFNVISEGILVFERDLNLRVEFESRVMGQYYLERSHLIERRRSLAQSSG